MMDEEVTSRMCRPARIQHRHYTDEQITEFLKEDALNGEALARAREFDRATGSTFFGADQRDVPDESRSDD